MPSRKVHFTLSSEALAIIDDRAESPNKRGAWISQAIVDYDGILRGMVDNTPAGVMEKIATRLGRIEQITTAVLREVKQDIKTP